MADEEQTQTHIHTHTHSLLYHSLCVTLTYLIKYTSGKHINLYFTEILHRFKYTQDILATETKWKGALVLMVVAVVVEWGRWGW